MQRNSCEEVRGHRYLMGKISRSQFCGPPNYIGMLREAVTCAGEGYRAFPDMAEAIQERLRWLEERGYDHHFSIDMITTSDRGALYDNYFVSLVLNDFDAAFWLRTVFGNLPMPDDYVERLGACQYADDEGWWL